MAMIHVVWVFALVDNQPSFVPVLCKFRKFTKNHGCLVPFMIPVQIIGVIALDLNIFAGALPIKPSTHSTLAVSTLIILFPKMLKFPKEKK